MATQTQADSRWEALRQGLNCPICPPREANNEVRLEIAPLSISTLYLFHDQRFRGYCLLAFDGRHTTSLEELDDREYHAYMADLRTAGQALRQAFKPDHMNYECLGNSTPHLQCAASLWDWHIVPRYKSDPRWGQPIWEGWPRNEFNLNRVTLSDEEYQAMINHIRTCLRPAANQ